MNKCFISTYNTLKKEIKKLLCCNNNKVKVKRNIFK